MIIRSLSLAATKRIFRNSYFQPLVFTLGSKMIGPLIGFPTGIILARLLGAEGFGELTIALAVVSILQVAVSAGAEPFVVRSIAKASIESRNLTQRKIFHFTLAGVFVSSFCISGILLAWLFLTADIGKEEALLWAMLLLPLQGTIAVLTGALRGYGYPIAAQLGKSVIRRSFALIAVFLFGTLWAKDFTVQSGVKVHLTGALFACFFLVIVIVLRESSILVPKIPAKCEASGWLRERVSLGLASSVGILLANADSLMLGVLSSADQVGFYRVASQWAEVGMWMLAAFDFVFARSFARHVAEGDLSSLRRVIFFSSAVSTCFSFSVLLLFIIFGEWMLSLFGDEFIAGFWPLVVLGVARITDGLIGSSRQLLIMSGREKELRNTLLLGLVLNVILNGALIPPFGAIGAATSTCVSLMSWNSVLAWRVYRLYGINPLFPWTCRQIDNDT